MLKIFLTDAWPPAFREKKYFNPPKIAFYGLLYGLYMGGSRERFDFQKKRGGGSTTNFSFLSGDTIEKCDPTHILSKCSNDHRNTPSLLSLMFLLGSQIIYTWQSYIYTGADTDIFSKGCPSIQDGLPNYF
jgi:hypothetical protein